MSPGPILSPQVDAVRGEGKHTPGPWKVARPWSGFSQITGPSGELIFGLAAGSAGEKRPDSECEANARLIAAAPELLAAASAVLVENDRIVTAMARSSPEEAMRVATAGGNSFSATLGPLRAAIAKATHTPSSNGSESAEASRADEGGEKQ